MDSRWKVFSLGKSECLTQPVQTILSPKQKKCSRFFSTCLKSTLNFEDFEKKDMPHSWYTSVIRDCKKPGYLNA